MNHTIDQSQHTSNATAAQSKLTSTNVAVAAPASHTSSTAGSVIEATDGLGNTVLIRLQNISSTANLGTRLDLKQIALRCRNTEFNPRRFAAVIMRIREPRATALIFASGKMCVTGTKSSHNSCLAVKKFAYIIEKVRGCSAPTGASSTISQQDVGKIDFQVHNIVGTADLGFPIRLEGLAYAHSTFASYEPELFPGLIYRLVEPRVVFLVFVSGKIVMTGARTEMDLSNALTKLFPLLAEFRKQTVVGIPGVSGGAIGRQGSVGTENGVTGGAVAAPQGDTNGQ